MDLYSWCQLMAIPFLISRIWISLYWPRSLWNFFSLSDLLISLKLSYILYELWLAISSNMVIVSNSNFFVLKIKVNIITFFKGWKKHLFVSLRKRNCIYTSKCFQYVVITPQPANEFVCQRTLLVLYSINNFDEYKSFSLESVRVFLGDSANRQTKASCHKSPWRM